jgi:hypothetical protein
VENPPPEHYAERAVLIARYGHLVLKFTPSYLSDSGNHEASWIGGTVAAGIESELLALVRAAMGDCGGKATCGSPTTLSATQATVTTCSSSSA